MKIWCLFRDLDQLITYWIEKPDMEDLQSVYRKYWEISDYENDQMFLDLVEGKSYNDFGTKLYLKEIEEGDIL